MNWQIALPPLLVFSLFQLGRWSNIRYANDTKKDLYKTINSLEVSKVDDPNWTRSNERLLILCKYQVNILDEICYF